MRKFLSSLLMACTIGVPVICDATQTCRSESEIPSSTPTSRFSDHGDGTVTDKQTGLMWSKCAVGFSGPECLMNSGSSYYEWQDALDMAAQSNLAGHEDWRMPNIKELLSIVEHRCYLPGINSEVFPNTPTTSTAYFWSASPSALDTENVWRVFSQFGDARFGKRRYSSYVRLVRSVQ